MAGDLLTSLLQGTTSLASFEKWIGSDQPNSDFFDEPRFFDVSRIDLSISVLDFIRYDRARCLTRVYSDRAVRPDSTSPFKEPSLPEKSSQIELKETYDQEFPSLKDGGKGKPRRRGPVSCPCPAPLTSSGKKGNRRRIKPTLVALSKGPATNGNLSGRDEAPNTVLSGCFKEERNLLQQKRSLSSMNTPKPSSSPLSSPSKPAQANEEQVLRLLNIYLSIISNGYVPDITKEVKMALQTLLKSFQFKKSEERPGSFSHVMADLKVFTTEDSLLLFTTGFISKQIEIFQCLDIFCIKALTHCCSFGELSTEARSLLQKELDDRNTFKTTLSPFREPPNVVYFSETDLSANFPSQQNFRDFCRQRDAVFELFDAWKKQRNLNHSSIIAMFQPKINALFEISVQPPNLAHLALLVVEQSVHFVRMNDHEGEKPSNFDLPHEKLVQLNKRMTQTEMKIEEGRAFFQLEVFFKLFVDFSLSYQGFRECLLDAIMTKIKEQLKNCLNFFGDDDQIPEDRCSTFFWTSRKLLLLGKYLGYVVFKKTTQLTIDNDLINYQLIPPVDLTMWLKRAYNIGTLILDVPWIIEALRMWDGKVSMTPHMKAILESLVSLYQRLCREISKSSSETIVINTVLTEIESLTDEVVYKHTTFTNVHLKRSTSFLLIFHIGSLFQTTGVRSETFYKLCTENNKIGTVQNVTNPPLFDCSNFVPRKLIHFFAPCISELKYTAMQGVVHTAVIKHIRPHQIDNQPEPQIKIDRTQKLLEMSFFVRYKGLKSTLEMIVDNVSAICKTYILNHIIATEKKNRKFLFDSDDDNWDSQEISATRIAQFSLKAMRTKIDHAVEDHSSNRISAAVDALVTPEHGEPFLNICKEIAQKKFRENLIPWASMNLPTERDIYLEVSASGIENMYPNIEIFDRSCTKSHWFDCTYYLQDTINIIFFKKEFPSELRLIKCIEGFKECDSNLLKQKDLIQAYNMTWEIMVLLMALGEKPVSDEILAAYIQFWIENEISDVKDRILCPRNLLFITESKSYPLTIKSFAKLLVTGMEERLYTPQGLKRISSHVHRTSFGEELQIVGDIFKECSILVKGTGNESVLKMLQACYDLTEEV